MGAEIERLEVVAETQFQSAFQMMDKFADRLDKICNSMRSINGSGITSLSNGLASLSESVQGFGKIKATDFNKIVNGINKFNSIDGNKISSISNAITPLVSTLSTLNNVNFSDKGINSVVNSISRLNSSLGAGINTESLNDFGEAINKMVSGLAGAGKLEARTTSIVSSIARLASAGDKTSATASGLPTLETKLDSFIATLAKAPLVSENTTQITAAIARLASAGNRAADTAKNLDTLSERLIAFIKSLTTAPQVSASTTQLVTAIGNIASAGGRANGVFNSLASGSTRSGSAVKSFVGSIKSLKTHLKDAKSHLNVFSKSTNNLAAKFGMFYAKFFLVIRGIKKFGQAIGSAQDYIEEFNYFSVALDKVGKDSANQFKKAGYNSAEEYAGSFRKRFGKLQKQLTGYKVDTNTGDATNTFSHNLGLDLTEVMNYNAAIAQITNSAGMLGETSIDSAKALTMLSADWASLANLDTADVMQNFQSGLVGQSRALYKYGIDITSAGLAQTAMNHGVTESIKNLSQQSKMQLRVLTMLEQSKVAYSDLARTINQPANQLRMLQAGFKKLSLTIGSLFMPIVQKLYPYMNAMVMVLQDFAQWVAKLAGIKLGDTDGSRKTPEAPDYSDAADDTDKVAKNMDKTAKKTKKAADNLQGFDIVNKLQDNSDSDSDDDDDDKNANIDLSKDISDALKNYEKIWDNAFKSNQNKAVELYKKMKKAILDAWKGGDFTSLGSALANWINKGMRSIPWTKIKKTTKKIAKSLATFLNGFVKDLDWTKLGENFSEGLNTWFETSYTFFKTFDWLKFGQSIKEGITAAINTFNAKLAGKSLGAKLRGMIQFAFGVMVDFPYKNLGKKIGDYINGFLEEMGEVRKNTGLTGWQELGKTISDGITGILDTIDTALSTVNWSEVGKAIGNFLGEIDWIGIFGRLANLIVRSLFAAIKVAFSAFKSDPLGVAGALASVVAGFMAYKKFKAVWGAMKIMFGNGLKDSLVKSATTIKAEKIASAWNGMFGKLGTKLGKVFGKAVAAVAVLEITGQLAATIGDKVIEKNSKEILSQISSGDISGKNALAMSSSWVGQLLKGNIISPEDYADQVAKEQNDKQNNEREQKHKKTVQKQSSKLGISENDYAEYKRQLKKFTDSAIEKGLGKDKVSSYITSFEKMLKNKTTNVAGIVKEMNKILNDETSGKSTKSLNNLTKIHMDQINIGASLQTTIIKKLSKAYKDGKISYADYEKIAGKAYGTMDEFRKALGKYGIELPKQSSKTKEFKQQTSNLKKKMDKLGVSTQDQADYMETLKTSLDNGTISWEDYKKITDKNYKSTDALKKKIDSLKSKSVKVNAETSGGDDVDSLQGKVDSVNSKTVTITAGIKGVDIKTFGDLSVAMKTMKNRDINVNISANLRKAWYKSVQKELYSRTFSINANTKVIKASGKEVEKATKSQTGKKYNGEKFKKLMNAVGTTQDQWGRVVIPGAIDYNGSSKKAKAAQQSKKWKELIKYLKKYGIATNNPILFANGGFPEDGWFRASHGEMMGKFDNGKSVVANNKQITTGISEAVAPAVYAATKAAIKEELSNANVGGGDVYLDGTKVTTAIMNNAKKISKNKGISWNMA